MRPLLIGGIVVGIGAALILRSRSKAAKTSHDVRNKATVANFEDHWSSATRLAVGLIGGGLMVYGMRAEGRVAKIASTAGLTLVTRSVTDNPIHDWAEVMKPHLTLSA